MHLSGGHDSVLRWFRGQQAVKLAANALELPKPEPDVELDEPGKPMEKEGIWVGPDKKFQVLGIRCQFCDSDTSPLGILG